MAYTKQINFSSTNNYGCGPDGEHDVYTIDEFIALCKSHAFIDWDGDGEPVKDGKSDPSITIKPSRLNEIPSDATHIVWYNK